MILDLIFKRKPKEATFKKWIKNTTVKQLQKYTKDWKFGITVDMTHKMWGHTFNVDPEKDIPSFVTYGHGFYSGGQLIGTRKLQKADILLLNAQSSRIGMFMILHIEYVKNPNDMFWAYLGCVGYKDKSMTTKGQ